MNTLQKLTIYVSSIVVLSFSLAGVATAAATPPPAPSPSKVAVCAGIGLTGGSTDCSTPAGQPDVAGTISQVINILSLLVGIAAVIMIMIGGFKYIISQGDSNNINSAKNTILYAVIGLVVALLAQVIVRFVINKL